MFGYIKVYKEELKIKEYNLYRGFYCGLCNALQKKYGLLSKFLLNYDCAFAATVLTMADGENTEYCTKQRCTFSPCGKRTPMAARSKALDFAAALNVILAYYSMADNKKDDKSIISSLGLLVFKGAYKKAKKEYPGVDAAVAKAIAKLADVENSLSDNIAQAAKASGEMLSKAVACYGFKDEQTAFLVRTMCENIGCLIYALDAWNDREKDKKKNSYNPFNLRGTEKERAMNYMYMTLSNARDAYELLEHGKTDLPITPILRNVFEFGCVQTVESVLSGTYNRKKKHGK